MPKNGCCFLLFILLVVGCDSARAPIDRVQPNYLNKQDLSGTWYYGKTVIDAPYGAGYTFVGEQSPLYKITWDIQERYAIARRSYAHVNGAEPEGISGHSEVGNAVAMYRIEKHFDIANDYNPITGEENNILVENAYDRPWFEREYMRIDWSTNLVSDNELLIFGRVFHGISFEPVAYFIPEQSEDEVPHPHAPKFEQHPESGELHYMDIVNKVFVRPTTTFFEGFGNVPDCYLSWYSTQDCAAADLAVRNSFLKVDDNNDYQPKAYTGDRMRRFGYFVTERPGFTQEYGPVDAARVRYINRYNLWKQSYQRDTNDSLIRCTAEDAEKDCGGNGSECDIEWGRAHDEWTGDGHLLGACTLPFRDRETKQIAYHVSPQFPSEFFDQAQSVINEWNHAFATTVSSVRENECLGLGGSATDCEDARYLGPEYEILVLCHNPVQTGDPSSCGEIDTQAHVGDLRYSLLGYVNEPNSFSPLGYGPSMADPQTGELINGTAMIYGTALDHVASFSRDVLALLNKDLAELDLMLGSNVDEMVHQQFGDASDAMQREGHRISVTPQSIKRIDQAMDFSWHPAHQRSAAASQAQRPNSLHEFMDRSAQSLRLLARDGLLGQSASGTALQSLKGSDIEHAMTGPEMRLAAGVPAQQQLTDVILEAASPLRGLSSSGLQTGVDSSIVIQKHACILHADFADDGMVGLARAIKAAIEDGDRVFRMGNKSYPITNDNGVLDYTQVRRMLRHVVFNSVAAHEMGHTLGLRHNFSGSFDSLNYHPSYWKIRDDGDMKPRAWDPLSEDEIDNRIREYQYSTVMDYGNNFVASDSHGLGHYDKAAIKLGYGDLIEVFSEAPDAGTINLIHAFLRGDWPVAIHLEAFMDGDVTAFQYTDLPEILGGIEGLEKRTDVPYSSLQADPFLLENAAIPDLLQDSKGRPTIPYRFCGDEEIGLRPECQQFDAGADVYESIQSVIDTYWNYHIFDAFRRGRLGFQTEWHAEKLYSRYFSKLKNANQIYVLFRSILTDIFGEEATAEFWSRPDGMGAWTAAVGASFQLLTQVVSTPEPGTYELGNRKDGKEALLLSTLDPTTVNYFEGRFIESTWDFDAGYYWFDQLNSVGFYYDKVAALQFLTDPEGYFIGRDTSADVREYQINFYTTFGPAMTSFFQGLLAEDWDTIGPRVTENGQLHYPDPLNLIERDLEGPALDPNASFSIQLFGTVFGMGNMPDTFSHTYFNGNRIFVDGAAESMTFPDDRALVTFIDPLSGLTYHALSFPDANGTETGVGAGVLQHAQALADNEATAELARYMDNVNLIRRLTWLFDLGDF